MLSIRPVISEILRELPLISSMVPTTWLTTSPPREAAAAAAATMALALCAASALLRMDWVMFSMELAVTCRRCEASPVRLLRSWLPEATSDEALSI